MSKRNHVTLTIVGPNIQVNSPYREEVVRAIKDAQLGGRWRRELKVWSFPLHQFEAVCKLYKAHYGTAGYSTQQQGSLLVVVDDYWDASLGKNGDSGPGKYRPGGKEPFTIEPVVKNTDGLFLGTTSFVMATRERKADAKPELFAGGTFDAGGFTDVINDKFTFHKGSVVNYPAVTMDQVEAILIRASRGEIPTKGLLFSVVGQPQKVTLTGGAEAKPSAQAPSTQLDVAPELTQKADELVKLLGGLRMALQYSGLPKAMIKKMLADAGLELTEAGLELM